MTKENSNWCTFVMLFTQLAAFIPFGINLTVLNSLAPAIEVFVNVTYIQRYNKSASNDRVELIIAMSQAALLVGSAIGCLCVRPMLIYCSRRTCLIWIHVLAVLSSVLVSPVAKFGQIYEALIAGRLLSGVSRGISFTVVALYTSELVHRKTLGLYQAFSTSSLQIGAALGNALGHPDVLGSETKWPYLLALPAIFSLIYLCASPWLIQTPTYLLIHSNESALASWNSSHITHPSFVLLRNLRNGDDGTVVREYKQLLEELEDNSHTQNATFREILTIKKYRKQLIAATIVQLSSQFTGAQGVFLYTNKIFNAAGVENEQAILYTIGLFFLFGISTFIAIPFLYKYGSRKMMQCGLLVVVISLILLTISTVYANSSMSSLGVVSLVVYFTGLGVGPAVALLAMPAEMATPRTRPIVLWVASVIFWFFGAMVAFCTPYAINAIGGYTYIIFIALVLFEMTYIKFFVPNTHNKTAAETKSSLQEQNYLTRRSSKEESAPTAST